MSNHISCSTAMNPSNMANSVMTNLEPIRFDSVALPAPSVATDADWTARLPVLKGRRMMLRELVKTDALSLLSMLSAEEVSRFISPPPRSVEGFERFIAWTLCQRADGAYACFAVTLQGFDTAIGIFQVRQLDARFETAEWGFALGSAFWGTGLFKTCAELVLDFTFDTLGVHRLEARAALLNGRGNGALLKLGAVQEAILRRSFRKNGVYLDQALYTIIADERRASRGREQHDLRFPAIVH
jgi:ribosomal-protein-alanine N-acetyltransferase